MLLSRYPKAVGPREALPHSDGSAKCQTDEDRACSKTSALPTRMASHHSVLLEHRSVLGEPQGCCGEQDLCLGLFPRS